MKNIEIQEYMKGNSDFYEIFINFIESEEDYIEEYQNLIEFIESKQIRQNRNQFLAILSIILKISKHHHRKPNFFNKITKLLLLFTDDYGKFFTNIEIFELFRKNKLLLLLLFKNKIIAFDESVANFILKKGGKQNIRYFFPEIKPFLNEQRKIEIEFEMTEYDSDVFMNFEEKREKGENESYICELIRQDSIEEFVSYVNRTNYPLLSNISSSFFETNAYLIKNKTSLIEYAAFFGSIQVFQYLKFNNVNITPSLWIYAVHGRNAELIHLLEDSGIHPKDEAFEEVLNESIKCHHNDIARYIINNLYKNKKMEQSNEENNCFNSKTISCIFRYFNFEFFPTKLYDQRILFYAAKYNYIQLVKLLLQTNKFKINAKNVLNIE